MPKRVPMFRDGSVTTFEILCLSNSNILSCTRLIFIGMVERNKNCYYALFLDDENEKKLYNRLACSRKRSPLYGFYGVESFHEFPSSAFHIFVEKQMYLPVSTIILSNVHIEQDLRSHKPIPYPYMQGYVFYREPVLFQYIYRLLGSKAFSVSFTNPRIYGWAGVNARVNTVIISLYPCRMLYSQYQFFLINYFPKEIAHLILGFECKQMEHFMMIRDTVHQLEGFSYGAPGHIIINNVIFDVLNEKALLAVRFLVYLVNCKSWTEDFDKRIPVTR